MWGVLFVEKLECFRIFFSVRMLPQLNEYLRGLGVAAAVAVAVGVSIDIDCLNPHTYTQTHKREHPHTWE